MSDAKPARLLDATPMPDTMQRDGVHVPRTEPAPMGIPVGHEPWGVGPQNMYDESTFVPVAFGIPMGSAVLQAPEDATAQWQPDLQQQQQQVDTLRRQEVLREWGCKREEQMHRRPKWLMDQMVSGSGLYPIRLLEPAWLTAEEHTMVDQLSELLQDTCHAHTLAMDLLAYRVYDLDVRIILDNSGSMTLDMFGSAAPSHIEATTRENPSLLQQVYSTLNMRLPFGSRVQPPPQSPLSPHHSRWYFARDALRRWRSVFSILRLDPPTYLLNGARGVAGNRVACSQLDTVFAHQPGGRTPMTEVLCQVLGEHQREAGHRPLLLLVLTDGEANDMVSFCRTLDEVQNGVYGDVQVCFMGLSLNAKDIEWFENEECDETRIRTVEAYEVEQRQIQLREVVRKEGGYNFSMHTYRVLLTNLFPADYDYEAPLQNLRHRLYITLHGRDRWFGIQSPLYKTCVSDPCCATCFLLSLGHCFGWGQGNEVGAGSGLWWWWCWEGSGSIPLRLEVRMGVGIEVEMSRLGSGWEEADGSVPNSSHLLSPHTTPAPLPAPSPAPSPSPPLLTLTLAQCLSCKCEKPFCLEGCFEEEG